MKKLEFLILSLLILSVGFLLSQQKVRGFNLDPQPPIPVCLNGVNIYFSTIAINSSSGNMYGMRGDVPIADFGIYKITPKGEVSLLLNGNFGNGDMVIDSTEENLYFSVPNESIIRRIEIATKQVTTIAGLSGVQGDEDGFTGVGTDPSLSALFRLPAGLGIDKNDNIYVADSFAMTIRKITRWGNLYITTTIAGTAGVGGYKNALGKQALFQSPLDVAVAPTGELYVMDTNNHAIRKIDRVGNVTTLINGLTLPEINSGIVADNAGNLYGTRNNPLSPLGSQIYKITPSGNMITIAGKGDKSGWDDGRGTEARFSDPSLWQAVDNSNNLYFGDLSRGNIGRAPGPSRIRKITPISNPSAGEDIYIVSTPCLYKN